MATDHSPLPAGYDIAAKRTGRYASRLEAEWGRALECWGLPAEYCGDRVCHFDFLLVIGGLPLPLEVKPIVQTDEPEDLVDRAVRRFHCHAKSNRVYQFATKAGKVADDKLVIVAGLPERARWWFALKFAPSAWHAVRVAGPAAVRGGENPQISPIPQIRRPETIVKWPVRGGEYNVANPLPFWVSQAHAGLGGEAAAEEQQGRLF